MNIATLWAELVRRNRLLAYAGLGNLGLLLVLAVIAAFDSTEILGINRWIKPMKFAASITVYQWTMAWLMVHLIGKERQIRRISWGIVIVMICEMIPIVGQPARGELSHFNTASPMGAAIFSFMGAMIVINTLLAAWVMWMFFTSTAKLPAAYLWGIRLGFIVFLLGSIEGGIMAAMGGHSVGVPDGGPGLPITNWSTEGGDLRIAHAIGLHALQTIPLAGYFLNRLSKHTKGIRPVTMTFVFATLQLVLATWLFVQAMNGRAFLSFKS